MFKEALQTIVEKTDGSLGALIMGADGLSVEKFFTDAGAEANLDVAAAEFTSLVRSASRSGKDLDLAIAGAGSRFGQRYFFDAAL